MEEKYIVVIGSMNYDVLFKQQRLPHEGGNLYGGQRLLLRRRQGRQSGGAVCKAGNKNLYGGQNRGGFLWGIFSGRSWLNMA